MFVEYTLMAHAPLRASGLVLHEIRRCTAESALCRVSESFLLLTLFGSPAFFFKYHLA